MKFAKLLQIAKQRTARSIKPAASEQLGRWSVQKDSTGLGLPKYDPVGGLGKGSSAQGNHARLGGLGQHLAQRSGFCATETGFSVLVKNMLDCAAYPRLNSIIQIFKRPA